MTNTTNEFTYIYDDYGNMIAEISPDGDEYHIEYQYDNQGRMVSMKFPNGDEEIWTYNDDGYIIYHMDVEGNEYLYDEKGKLISDDQ